MKKFENVTENFCISLAEKIKKEKTGFEETFYADDCNQCDWILFDLEDKRYSFTKTSLLWFFCVECHLTIKDLKTLVHGDCDTIAESKIPHKYYKMIRRIGKQNLLEKNNNTLKHLNYILK